MNSIIEDLNWRYATKKYDPSKRISDEDFETIKESLRLTASSFGLQPWKFLIVENKELRERLKVASWGQPQITDASHMIILCSYLDVDDSHVDAYMKDVAETRNIPLEATAQFGNYIKQAVGKLTTEEKGIWTSKQAYIALGEVLHTCARLRVDATPLEGFEPVAYDEILGLSAQNLHATLVVTIGYRHEEDRNQHLAKVRRKSVELFEVL